MNIRRAEHSRAVHVSYSKPEGALAHHCCGVVYIYAFSRRFYPKRLTVHSDYTCFISICVPWESNPQPFALLTQCSTTEPQEHSATGCADGGSEPARL